MNFGCFSCESAISRLRNATEAGWVLHPQAQGQGFGQEAAQAAHDWFDRVVTGPLVCLVSGDNAGSLQVAEAMGYAPLRETTLNDAPVSLLFRKTPPGSPKNIFEELQPVV